jgi:hypothetical protein
VARAQTPADPKRYMTLYFPNGTAPYWKPSTPGSGNGWQLSPILEPLAPMKDYVTVVSNVGNYSPFGGHIEPSHGHNCASAFTGVKANGQGNANNGISIDQIIGNRLVEENGGNLVTPLHSLQVGLSTMISSFDGIPEQHSRSISWKSATEPLYYISSPQGVFDRLVGSGLPSGNDDTPDPLAERRRLLKQSSLDFVIEQATDLQVKLSVSDRAKLQQFLESVRTLEQRVSDPTMPGTGGNTCNPVTRPTETFGVQNVPADYNRGAHATLMIDLVVMAIQCDVTRVVSFMLDDARSDYAYNFIYRRNFTETSSTPTGQPANSYHGAQHGDAQEFGSIIYWNAERANELATKLAAINEGSGNVLDNTLITFMSGMNGGNHDGLDLPIALIGGSGGVLKKNQYIDFGGVNLADLHFTVMQKVYGSTLPQFGTPMGNDYTTAGTNILSELLA